MDQAPSLRYLSRVSIAVLIAINSGCAGGENVTTGALAAAHLKWYQAHILNYNLEWTSTGARNAHYRVFVRGGKVRLIYSLLPDGREIEVHPAKPEYFGVDGLFDIIEEELAQLQSPTPFSQPKGTKIVLRFTPDPKLGYPRSYRRDVFGTPQGISIDVIRLDPNPPEALPSPSA